jgi:hypothetical protein
MNSRGTGKRTKKEEKKIGWKRPNVQWLKDTVSGPLDTQKQKKVRTLGMPFVLLFWVR